MRPKTLDVVEKNKSFWRNPGPGAYHDIDLRPQTGKFVYSKFEDVQIAKLNLNSQRFGKIRESPGPQDYPNEDNLSNRGKYVHSKNKGAGIRAFSQSGKSTFTD
jgi:hypothetical protein